MRGIHKRFGAVQANKDVTLTVSSGTEALLIALMALAAESDT